MAKRKKSAVKKVSKQFPILRPGLKRKPAEKSFAEKWIEFKAEEKALAEAKSPIALRR